MEEKNSFAEMVRERRKALDLTQEELGDRAGCSRDAISKIEQGLRRPSRQLAGLISEVLITDPAERRRFVLSGRTSPLSSPSATSVPVGGTEKSRHQIGNPYIGLRAFDEEDGKFFFGREALVARLHARLLQTSPLARFLAVVGPSGSGKSSVVRAGLIPALRRANLASGLRPTIATIVPGPRPLDQIESALHTMAVAHNPTLPLANGFKVGHQAGMNGKGALKSVVSSTLPPQCGAEAILFIDQFEEIFTLSSGPAVCTYLLDELSECVRDPRSCLRIIVALRADFYDQPLLYGAGAELLRERTEVVGPLTPEELHRAIVGPAQCVGVDAEPALVATIEQEVGERPGALPLLQYTLTELFNRREERREGRSTHQVMTLEAYHAIGGVRGALAGRAEEIYAGFSEAAQEETRQLFLRLVTPGEGVEDARRRVRRSELASAARDEEELDQVLDTLGRYRLLTFDRDPLTRTPTVEVVHEALLQAWPRLRRWLDDNRERVRLHRQLMASATEWIDSGKEPSFLATGVRLSQLESLGTTDPTGPGPDTVPEPGTLALTADEREYLQASVQAREHDRRARERLRRRITTGLVVGMVLTLLLAAIAVVQSAQANEQRNTALIEAQARATSEALAQEQRSIAFSRELAAKSQTELAQNPTLALLLGIEAARVRKTDEAADALRRALIETQPHTELRNIANAAGTGRMGQVVVATYSPDGKWVLTAGGTSSELWEVSDRTGTGGNLLADFPNPKRSLSAKPWATSAAFRPDGKQIVVALNDGRVWIWDIEGQEPVIELVGHKSVVVSVAYSPDGKRIATAGSDRTAHIWDAATSRSLLTLEGHTARLNSIAFSPDGRFVVTASDDESARVWDSETGTMVLQIRGHTDEVNSAAFSPNGERIITASSDKSAQIWDANTGKNLLVFLGHAREVQDAEFSPNGKFIVTGGSDNTARVWDANSGQSLAVIDAGEIAGKAPGTGEPVWPVSFSPDGAHVLMVTYDGTARIYPWSLFTELDSLLQQAESLAPRGLTCEERQTYLHEDMRCGTPTPVLPPASTSPTP